MIFSQPDIFNSDLDDFDKHQQHQHHQLYQLHRDILPSSFDPSSLTTFNLADRPTHPVESFKPRPLPSTESYSSSDYLSYPSDPVSPSTFDRGTPRGIVHLPESGSSTSPAAASLQISPILDDIELPDIMSTESWNQTTQLAARPMGRLSHQRESSLSSLGSTGPASPFSHLISNPHIAVADGAGDGLADMQAHDSGNNHFYQLAKSIPPQEGLYPGYYNIHNLEHPEMGYPSAIALQRPRSDKVMLPTPDFPAAHGRSRPTSVASSTAGGDSPATPPLGEPEDHKRQKSNFVDPPKLDRTMTDIYSDELYSPSFTITSASPSRNRAIVSPTSDVFAQRLHAANSQHLSAQSPTSSVSRDRSPFRHGSPLAPTVNPDFGTSLASANFGANSALAMGEQEKSLQSAESARRQQQRQLVQNAQPETPETISPKDAMLEFQGSDSDNTNWPSLFSQAGVADFGITAGHSIPSHQQQLTGLRGTEGGGPDITSFPYVAPQFAAPVQVPQQYPFIARSQQPQGTSQNSSTRSSSSNSATPTSRAKPPGAYAESGTYTCTYHGCTLRFETPALLQKHKREGHRQPQGLSGGSRRSELNSVANGVHDTQAGPHRCDRINPSTGKPCGTIFSRPYDLTRHEDTIHNARKQKVRCDLCTEEKTFSRADALTRHYRVCHPDVEFAGKHRKRAGS